MSNGRADIGFARGYLPYEFDAFKIGRDGSRKRYSKTINSVIKLWKENNCSQKTEFFDYSNVTIYPKPIQKPNPPFLGSSSYLKRVFCLDR